MSKSIKIIAKRDSESFEYNCSDQDDFDPLFCKTTFKKHGFHKFFYSNEDLTDLHPDDFCWAEPDEWRRVVLIISFWPIVGGFRICDDIMTIIE
jgi:hypothetical protein